MKWKYLDIYIGVFAAGAIMLLSFSGVLSSGAVGNATLGVLIIVLTVSLKNRKDFSDTVNTIKEHELGYVLGGMVPEPIYNHIRDHVVRNSFLRIGSTVDISLKDIGSGFVELVFKDRYTVRNISSTTSKYKIKGIIEKEFDYEQEKNRFESLSFTQNGRTNRFSGGELYGHISETENTIKLEMELVLAGGEEVEITTRRIKVQRDIDSNYWKPPQISDGLTVNVSHPDNFEVSANSFHPSESPLNILINDIDEKSWKVNEAVLPYQGINVRWKKI